MQRRCNPNACRRKRCKHGANPMQRRCSRPLVRICATHPLLSGRHHRWNRHIEPGPAAPKRREKTHCRDRTPRLIAPISAAPIRSISIPFRHTARHGSPPRSVGSGREISEALAAGHTIGDIRRELALDGLEISYSNLRTHVARLRKSHPHQPTVNCYAEPPAPLPTNVPVGAPPAVPPTNPAARAAEVAPYDPLANLRDRLTRRPGFQYDDRPPDEKKLI